MKQLIFKAAAVLFFLLLGITACGGASSDDETFATGNPVLILFYTDN